MDTQTTKDIICEDCGVTVVVKNQHITRVKKCLLCKAIYDRKRRNLHQRDMRILKKRNKILSPAIGAHPVKNEVNGNTGDTVEDFK